VVISRERVMEGIVGNALKGRRSNVVLADRCKLARRTTILAETILQTPNLAVFR
jgi:hypothetical protein